MKTKINFLGCKYLDFSDHYSAKKEAIFVRSETKICWNRPVMDSTYPSLVQFCKKRGRLSNPVACLCESDKMCFDYIDFNHTVIFDNDI